MCAFREGLNRSNGLPARSIQGVLVRAVPLPLRERGVLRRLSRADSMASEERSPSISLRAGFQREAAEFDARYEKDA